MPNPLLPSPGTWLLMHAMGYLSPHGKWFPNGEKKGIIAFSYECTAKPKLAFEHSVEKFVLF